MLIYIHGVHPVREGDGICRGRWGWRHARSAFVTFTRSSNPPRRHAMKMFCFTARSNDSPQFFNSPDMRVNATSFTSIRNRFYSFTPLLPRYPPTGSFNVPLNFCHINFMDVIFLYFLCHCLFYGLLVIFVAVNIIFYLMQLLLLFLS